MARAADVLALTEKANRVLTAGAMKEFAAAQTHLQKAADLLGKEDPALLKIRKALAFAAKAQISHQRAMAHRRSQAAQMRHTARSRAPRVATNARTRGSRRSTPRRSGAVTRAGPSDDDGESEPPGLRLWRHPDYGDVTPNLYRLLLREGRS